jgi:hypothetical protein
MNFGLKPSFIVDFQLLCLIAGGYEVRSSITGEDLTHGPEKSSTGHSSRTWRILRMYQYWVVRSPLFDG